MYSTPMEFCATYTRAWSVSWTFTVVQKTEDVKSFTCSKCSKGYTTEEGMDRHFKRAHESWVPKTCGQPRETRDTTVLYSTQIEYARHMNMVKLMAKLPRCDNPDQGYMFGTLNLPQHREVRSETSSSPEKRVERDAINPLSCCPSPRTTDSYNHMDGVSHGLPCCCSG